MFFYLSKIIGFFLLPSHILVGMSGLGILLLWTRWQTAARLYISTGVAGLLIIGFSPLGNILILPLEERFPNEIPAGTKSFAGIIVLGGGTSSNLSFHRQQALTNEAGERILGAAELVRRFPNIPVIYSGGSNALWDEKNSEARIVEEFILPVVKIDPNIVRFEIRAKNTYENAIEVKKMIQEPASDPWLLVTSAYHMPRSVGVFRKAGHNVVPWSTDFRTRGTSDRYRPFAKFSEGVKRVDTAMREWIGLLAYYITGKTSTLFPGPAGHKTIKSN